MEGDVSIRFLDRLSSDELEQFKAWVRINNSGNVDFCSEYTPEFAAELDKRWRDHPKGPGNAILDKLIA